MNWMQSLGLTLLHFVWQGLLIGTLATVANRALRRASANARYIAACSAMALMGATAIGTFLWCLQPGTSLAVEQSTLDTARTTVTELTQVTLGATTAAAAERSWTRFLPWLDYLWFAGVCALAFRSATSWMAALRLRRSGVRLASVEWQERAFRLIERLEISAPVRLCESAIAEVPSVIGWLRPVILFPASTLAGLTPEQLETILAHELAHIRRHDYLINLLQTAIETLLFYHPAVWWVGNRMRTERENCCDDLAVEVCGDAFLYARALANLEQLRHTGQQGFALAATDAGLLTRIARVLGHRPAEQRTADTRSYWLPALLMIMLAAAGLVAQQRTPAAPVPPKAPIAPSPLVAFAPEPPAPVPAPAAAPSPEPAPAAETAPLPEAPEAPQAPEPPNANEKHHDYIAEMEQAGYKGLTVDQLIELKIHGVTPEYIQKMKASGMNLTLDQMAAFRIQGVSPEFVNEWKTRGWNLTPDQLLAFRIHGVNPAAIDQMKAAGYTLDPENAIAMRIHGVTPEFAKSWKDAGFGDVPFDKLLTLRIHGASAQTVTDLRTLGFTKLTLDNVIEARIFGVNGDFIKRVHDHGFNNLTFEQLIRLRQADIIR